MPKPRSIEQRLIEARQDADWTAVVALLAANWSELYQDHPLSLLAVLDALPEEVLGQEPRLRLAQRHIRRNLRREPENQAYGDILREEPGSAPIDYLAALTGRIAAARAAGRHDDAITITATAVTYLNELPIEVVPSLGNALPEFHYHWGLTFLHASRFEDAARQFSASYDWARTVNHRMMMVSSGGANAFIHAVHGRARDATEWLDKLPAIDPADWWASFAPTAAKLAEAMVHIDQLDLAAASAVISQVDITRSPEYWAPYFAVRAYLVTEISRTAQPSAERTTSPPEAEAQALLSAFESYLEALQPNHTSVALNAEYTGLIRYLLLLNLHQPDRAIRELSPEEVSPTASVVRQIGITLYASRLLQLDQPALARKLIVPLLATPDSRPRVLIPALMVAAATDTVDRSEQLYLRAAALASWNHSYVGFTLSPVEERHRMADRIEAAAGTAVASRLRLFSDRPSVPGFDALTRREAVVIREALNGMSNAQISVTYRVSINTVKTQLRSAYRKLGVSSRRQLSELFHL